MMDTTWIVSADTGRARIFSETDPAKPLKEVEAMVNPAARLRTADASTGGALPPQSPDEHEAESFARELTAYLLIASQEGRFDKLALVAPPGFLGNLRHYLHPQLKPLVSYEINKDYSRANPQQLREQIRAHQARG